MRLFSGALLAVFPFFIALRGVVCQEAFVSALRWLRKVRWISDRASDGYTSNSPEMIFSTISA
jgi:hypothetical protein